MNEQAVQKAGEKLGLAMQVLEALGDRCPGSDFRGGVDDILELLRSADRLLDCDLAEQIEQEDLAKDRQTMDRLLYVVTQIGEGLQVYLKGHRLVGAQAIVLHCCALFRLFEHETYFLDYLPDGTAFKLTPIQFRGFSEVIDRDIYCLRNTAWYGSGSTEENIRWPLASMIRWCCEQMTWFFTAARENLLWRGRDVYLAAVRHLESQLADHSASLPGHE